MRRTFTIAIGVLISMAFACLAACAAEPTPEELRQKFQETVVESRLALVMKDDRLSGPGAEFLKARAVGSQFFMVGEEHGVATIADTVRALFADLSPIGYRHFAIEVDPWMTAKMEGLLRSGGTKALTRFLTTEDRALSLPFYSWSAEAALAAAAVRANADSTPALWGLDQLFIGAAGVLLADVATAASRADARSLAAVLAGQAKGNLEFLGKVEIGKLQALRDLLGDAKDRDLARLMDDMILSARIYQPFVSGEGLSVYAANLERENLMKRTFLARYREAEKRDGKAPRVLFKFGGNHMQRGLSATHVPSLGNFVSDFALHEGAGAFNVMVLCGPGTKAGDFMGNEAACDLDFASSFADLVAHVDTKNPTLFDLRAWKDKPKRWAHLSTEVRELIWAYDAFLFLPNGKPAAALK
ncbi:MAG: hypothetical protein K8S25_06265 [Alphaproteobacteria bacterium]|nr:hypothetical protein [Alphaproteobacteria bacterium]